MDREASCIFNEGDHSIELYSSKCSHKPTTSTTRHPHPHPHTRPAVPPQGIKRRRRHIPLPLSHPPQPQQPQSGECPFRALNSVRCDGAVPCQRVFSWARLMVSRRFATRGIIGTFPHLYTPPILHHSFPKPKTTHTLPAHGTPARPSARRPHPSPLLPLPFSAVIKIETGGKESGGTTGGFPRRGWTPAGRLRPALGES